MSNENSYTVEEWCHKHRLCRATFYNLRKVGKGPRILKAGSRTLITSQADLDWQREREAETAEGIA
jgi:hypothetical protein